ncbi:S-adenosylmethionine-dependent methyltransferase Rv2258c-like [Branchiostoma lanceolatum]|uniref:S-adenosylmethionine-dependent methyltransferase Rv2258c-like n=1 Tax=Branchiostoma lanceolatum TaxID=7740 RepID=UPI003453D426
MAEGETAPETADQFALRMVTTVSSGFVSLGIAVGARTGLIAQLAEADGPETAVQIAEKACMKERYVREWLAIMVTARIVDYDKEQKTYFLPKHRAGVLVPDGAMGSMGNWSDFVRQAAMVANDVADCFKNDGPKGVPYSAYPEFNGWMAEIRENEHKSLVSKFLPTIPGLAEALESGIRVIDAGCGRGIATLTLAQHFPKSTFVGTDFSEEVIQWANEENNKRGLANVTFQVHDLAKMPDDWSDSFDYVLVWDVIHDQADPEMALREIFRMVKPGGRFSMVDIKGHSDLADNMGNPAAPLLYGASLFHCMTVSLYFGGKGLGTLWGQELAAQMLQEAGFTDVQALDLPHSPVEIHFLCNKP